MNAPILWPKQNAAAAFYGDPRGSGDKPNRNWEKNNLIMITPPFAMTYAGHHVGSITIHKKCGPSLSAVFDDIWARSGKSQAIIDKWGVSIYGGAYNYRLKRGSNNLSMHAFAAAIDLDPANHPMIPSSEPPSTKLFDKNVLAAFAAQGWVNLPHDPMHFQAARL